MASLRRASARSAGQSSASTAVRAAVKSSRFTPRFRTGAPVGTCGASLTERFAPLYLSSPVATGRPRPSAEFPAVDPARDLPAAAALIRRLAVEQHPYSAVLLGMAAEVLEAVPEGASDPGWGEDGCPDCGQQIEHVRAEHTRMEWEDGARWPQPCPGSFVQVATTPGDDRGRELAEIADQVQYGLGMFAHDDPRGGERAIREAMTDLRALAAPAETEAEKPPLLAAVHRLGGQGRIRAFERSEDGRWFPACLRHWEDPFSDDLGTFETGNAAQLSLVPHILRWHPEWLTDAERLAATPQADR